MRVTVGLNGGVVIDRVRVDRDVGLAREGRLAASCSTVLLEDMRAQLRCIIILSIERASGK